MGLENRLTRERMLALLFGMGFHVEPFGDSGLAEGLRRGTSLWFVKEILQLRVSVRGICQVAGRLPESARFVFEMLANGFYAVLGWVRMGFKGRGCGGFASIF